MILVPYFKIHDGFWDKNFVHHCHIHILSHPCLRGLVGPGSPTYWALQGYKNARAPHDFFVKMGPISLMAKKAYLLGPSTLKNMTSSLQIHVICVWSYTLQFNLNVIKNRWWSRIFHPLNLYACVFLNLFWKKMEYACTLMLQRNTELFSNKSRNGK